MVVVLAGATGLVGTSVLNFCLHDESITQVFAYTRNLEKVQKTHPKLIWLLLADVQTNFPEADALVMTLGTTMAKAGSKEAFWEVDVELPYKLAKKARECGVSSLLNVSAKGAHPKSFYFYNRAKAELEQRLVNLNFDHLVILRPSLLLGKRSESRPAEWLAQKLMGGINNFFPATVRAVPAEIVAHCIMVNLHRSSHLPKVIFFENQDIISSAKEELL